MWSVAFSPDGTKALSGGGDHKIKLWYVGGAAPDKWTLLKELGEHDGCTLRGREEAATSCGLQDFCALSRNAPTKICFTAVALSMRRTSHILRIGIAAVPLPPLLASAASGNLVDLRYSVDSVSSPRACMMHPGFHLA